jgi:hypothetical protein
VAALVPTDVVLQAVARAGERSQPAWSLLYYALWHSYHVLGIDASGDIAAVLTEAAR